MNLTDSSEYMLQLRLTLVVVWWTAIVYTLHNVIEAMFQRSHFKSVSHTILL